MLIPFSSMILLMLAGFIGTFVGGMMGYLWLAALWHGHSADPAILVYGGAYESHRSHAVASIRRSVAAV
jgi:hypothetical protein